MAETVGSLIDKITISNLKIFHMKKQIKRKNVDKRHIVDCRQRLKILTLQKNDLADELYELIKNIFKGNIKPKLYRQYKMYNDPKYRIKTK